MSDAPAPRRGRPPKLSREQITRDVAELLLADPAVPLTISRVAEAIGASPMSLYRHFTDRDDLVASVAKYLLFDERPPVRKGASWQEQIRVWMLHSYRQSIRVPQLTQLIASGESPAWITDSAYLAGLLQEAGFEDGRALAEAVYWVATAALGQAVIDAMGRPQYPLQETADALSRHADQAAAEQVSRLLPHFAAMHGHHMERIADWTIAALEQELRKGTR